MNMNIDNKELNDQLLGHITRLQAVYPRIWDVYCTEVNRGLLIGICRALVDDYINNKKTIEEVIDTYNKLGGVIFAPNWFDFSLDYAYVSNLKYKFDVPDEMLNKQKEFMAFVSETLYTESENSKEAIYLTADQYMINKLIKDMLSDLERLMNVFGAIYVQDVLKTFIINFWDKDILIKCAQDDNGLDLDCIAYKFDELFGNMIGDNLIIESDRLSKAEIDRYKEDYLRRFNAAHNITNLSCEEVKNNIYDECDGKR